MSRRPLRESAIDEWRAIVGSENVVTEAGVLENAQTATFPTGVTVPVMVRPQSTAEVVKIIEVANRCSFPVYPVSSGKNWGYGSSVPTSDLCALLDLGRMNRILDYNEKLAYVTIEPGVTQKQLFSFLQAGGGRLWMDASGSSSECSVIGNTMERGFGHTPYGDHFAHMCGMELVLGNGAVVETGFSGYANSNTGSIYRYGVGPTIDGLFSQSNLGVCTRMTVWLMRAPECFEAFFFCCEKEDSLPALVDSLRPLRQNGTLRSSVHVGNDYKVLSGIRQYPWEHTGGATPLKPADMGHFRKALHFGYWNGSGGLYGSRDQVAAARRLVKRALRGKVSRLQFLTESKLDLAARFSRVYQIATGWDLKRTLDLARPVFNLMRGIPTDETMGSVYWRKRQPAPGRRRPQQGSLRAALVRADRAAGRRTTAQRVATLASDVLLEHGFEPMLSLTLVDPRAIACVISIGYDRDVPGEDERAVACHERLLKTMLAAGYPPYRLGVQSMHALTAPAPLTHLLDSIRSVTDPNRILSPGRYVLDSSVRTKVATQA